MKRILFYAAIIAVLLYSCSNGSGSAQDIAADNNKGGYKAPAPNAKSSATGGGNYAAVAENVSAADTAVTPQITPQSGNPARNPDWDKKIIKTANISLEVQDFKAYNSGMHIKVKSYGAYIAQEQQSETDGQVMNEISIKVPVDKFEDMINSLGGDGIKIVQKNITSEDVTGEVVDTKARLEAKKQVRDTYLTLLKQAKTMKDILDVQEQVNAIQEDIESAAGRVDYLVHSAAYSTVNIKYYQFINGVTAHDIEPTFVSKVVGAFKTGGEIVSNILLFFISIWPLCIAAIVLVVYFKKGYGRKNKKISIE